MIKSKPQRVEVVVGGRPVVFEAGLLALQAAGSATCQLGNTIVFSAVTTAKSKREGVDFFPLQVEFREKTYAAGRFPGGYFKREARPTEKEILTARMTDRPIRPLFPEGFFDEVQINNAMLCADGQFESDIPCINAASAALTLSELPFKGPVGAVRVGRVDGRFILNPTQDEMEKSDLNLVYVGTRELPMMIEGHASEISEDDLVAAMRLAHEAIIPIVDAQIELRRRFGLPDKVITDSPVPEDILSAAREIAWADMDAAMEINDKQQRQTRVAEIGAALKEKLLERFPNLDEITFKRAFDALEIAVVRHLVLEKGRRIGGRGFEEIRPLSAQVGLLPRTHGSALFNRGETQALATVTLGTMSDAQEMDALTGGPEEKRFMFHYNFPPYSVGEVGRIGPVGRREVGHGALAERSLLPVMPKDYPYTVRVVSEIMGSNGSSSMASVCAGSLALMDAGVPVSSAVAGISIGLFTGAGKAQLVTDIIGAEDHCGDMDFKVAGTRKGITGFQVDLKIPGLPWDLVRAAFEQARRARLQLLDFMDTVIAKPRPDLSPYAPRITVLKINPEKIGALIGPGGKNVRRITELTGAQIDIDDDGTVHIYSSDKQGMEQAVREVTMATAEAEEGKIYQGTVTGVKEFGAFVEILPGQEGLVHISELANFRVKRVEDVVKVGDVIWVKCISVDESGKIRLSRRAAMEERRRMGADASEKPGEKRA